MRHVAVLCLTFLWACSARDNIEMETTPVEQDVSAVHGNNPRIVETATVDYGSIRKTETIYQVGDVALNRFTVHHVQHERCKSKGPVILVPGLGANFDIFELTEGGDYMTSLPATLAKNCYDVWGYSRREKGIKLGDCESGRVDCSPMKDWGMATVLDDVAFITDLARKRNQNRRPVLGGGSYGGMVAVAAADRSPQSYSGIMLWDSLLYSADPALRASTQTYCNQATSQIASGQLYDNTLLPLTKTVLGLSQSDPNGASPLGIFPAGTTNHMALLGLFGASVPGPIAINPGFLFDTADFVQGRFVYASEARLQNSFGKVNDYFPTALLRDFDCSVAGDRAFTSRLGAFHGYVHAIKTEKGFGPVMQDTLDLFSSAAAIDVVDAPGGHVDWLESNDHRLYLEQPFLAWLAAGPFAHP